MRLIRLIGGAVGALRQRRKGWRQFVGQSMQGGVLSWLGTRRLVGMHTGRTITRPPALPLLRVASYALDDAHALVLTGALVFVDAGGSG